MRAERLCTSGASGRATCSGRRTGGVSHSLAQGPVPADVDRYWLQDVGGHDPRTNAEDHRVLEDGCLGEVLQRRKRAQGRDRHAGVEQKRRPLNGLMGGGTCLDKLPVLRTAKGCAPPTRAEVPDDECHPVLQDRTLWAWQGRVWGPLRRGLHRKALCRAAQPGVLWGRPACAQRLPWGESTTPRRTESQSSKGASRLNVLREKVYRHTCAQHPLCPGILLLCPEQPPAAPLLARGAGLLSLVPPCLESPTHTHTPPLRTAVDFPPPSALLVPSRWPPAAWRGRRPALQSRCLGTAAPPRRRWPRPGQRRAPPGRRASLSPGRACTGSASSSLRQRQKAAVSVGGGGQGPRGHLQACSTLGLGHQWLGNKSCGKAKGSGEGGTRSPPA